MNKAVLVVVFFMLSSNLVLAQCDYCSIRNLVCPENVAAGQNFIISYEFYGTGPAFPYETRSVWQGDTKLDCHYRIDKPDCSWNSDSFIATAPTEAGTYTYSVKSYGAASPDAEYCSYAADDEKSCEVNVVSADLGFKDIVDSVLGFLTGFATAEQAYNSPDTETLRPNAIGTYSQATPKPVVDNYLNVDEASADDWTTHVLRHWTEYAVDTYGLPDSSGTGTINSVTVYSRVTSYTTNGNAKLAVYTNSNLHYGSEEDMLQDWKDISKTWTTNPETLSAWTWTEINNLEAGIALKAESGGGGVCTQIYVEVDYTPRSSATETFRPNAIGTNTEIASQIPNSGAHWDKVDEVSPDGLTTRISSGVLTYQLDTFNIPDHSEGSGTINHVKVYIDVEGASDLAKCKIAIRTQSTEYYGDEKTPATDFGEWTWGSYSKQWDTNPNTNLAWTWAEIDALETGIAIRGSGEPDWDSVYCTQVYVEVDYTPDTCTDSDGGLNYYVKGTCKDQRDYYKDYCSKEILIEYYCNAWSYCEYEKYVCPYGCKDGACLKESEIIPADCQNLFDKINASFLASCGSTKYDYVADLNNDKIVDISDFSLLSANSNNAAWCSDKILNPVNPCEKLLGIVAFNCVPIGNHKAQCNVGIDNLDPNSRYYVYVAGSGINHNKSAAGATTIYGSDVKTSVVVLTLIQDTYQLGAWVFDGTNPDVMGPSLAFWQGDPVEILIS